LPGFLSRKPRSPLQTVQSIIINLRITPAGSEELFPGIKAEQQYGLLCFLWG